MLTFVSLSPRNACCFCRLSSLFFSRKTRKTNKIATKIPHNLTVASSSFAQSLFSNIVQTGVRYLQPQAKLLYLTRVVDALLEAKQSSVMPRVQES